MSHNMIKINKFVFFSNCYFNFFLFIFINKHSLWKQILMDQVILKDIQDMIRKPVTSELLSYVSDQAALVIPCYSHQTTSSSSAIDGKYGVLPPLASFIGFLVKRSSVRTGTLLGSLVFLQRLQQTLANIAKGMPCTSHRIFLATLIVTSKALHDTSPKNKHWAKYAAYFTLSEINLMEKQLLSLMVNDAKKRDMDLSTNEHTT